MDAAERTLGGHRRGPRRYLPFLGPAFIAAVAYIDPGNFAVNTAAGAQFGYALLWAIVVANVMAMVVQTLSAKVGIATGRNLAELCREHFPRPVVVTVCGSRPSWSRWRPTWPSSSGPRSASTSCSGCRWWSAGDHRRRGVRHSRTAVGRLSPA